MTKSSMKVPIARTVLTESEIQSVLEPLRSGWLVQGPKVLSLNSYGVLPGLITVLP